MAIRLIQITDGLLENFGTRTDDGRKLTAEWGPVVAYAGDSRGIECEIYEPVFTATDDGMTVVRREKVAIAAADTTHTPYVCCAGHFGGALLTTQELEL